MGNISKSMKDRIEKVKRKIKVLEKEKEEYDKKLSELLYPFGIFCILKKSIRKETLLLRDISGSLEMEIKDLYEELNELERK